MPPHADQLLEERILKAAQRLWRTRGEEGLTLRAVAKEAATTTPTVYKRFRNKEALMIGVAMRIRSQLNEALFAAKSVQQVYRVYLRFAEEHPHELRPPRARPGCAPPAPGWPGRSTGRRPPSPCCAPKAKPSPAPC